MGRLSIMTLSLALVALPLPSAGDTVAPRTLEEYRALSRAANPSVRAAMSGARAATERVGVARGYPDPFLMYGYYVAPDPMQGRQELELRQEIPFPGKRGLRGDVAAREADMIARSADALALDVDFEVAEAFYEYVRASEVGRVLEDERGLVIRMRDVTRVRYSSGTAEQQEVLKLELALSQIDDARTMNEHERDHAGLRLNELTGRDARAPLAAPEWTTPDPSALEAMAISDSALVHRPEMAAARAGLERAQAARKLAGREYIPDFMLGVMFEYGADRDEEWEVLAGVSLPIWLGKRRAMVRETEAMREAARHALQAEELRVRRDVEDALHAMYSARERLERFEQLILPQAEQAFESSEAGYRAGRVDFMDYLDSERMLLAMRKEYYGVVAELGMRVAALERALGYRAE
ncbi:MAG TPA: TolC family protein [Candidatus Krumholzibacteria bacterium]|nr:TolC family protein [Candidatus Krumholzibacteria bacterium]